MNLGAIVRSIPTLLQDALKIAGQKMQPAPTGLTLEQLIQRENLPFTSPRTGGVIHQIVASVCTQVAALIRRAASGAGIDVALLAAWIAGESRFDPAAFNPNRQNDKPGQTPEQAFAHADVGIAQFDGAIIAGLPGMAGLTWQQQSVKALDPVWAVPQMARMIASLKAWGEEFDAQLRSFGVTEPIYGTPITLYGEAYNVGRGGAAARAIANLPDLVVTLQNGVGCRKNADAATIARSDELVAKAKLKPGFGYGASLAARYAQFRAELSATP